MRHLPEEFRRALLNLRVGEIFLARGNPPRVASRIGDGARPVAPELVGHRHLHGRALADCAIEQSVAVVHVKA